MVSHLFLEEWLIFLDCSLLGRFCGFECLHLGWDDAELCGGILAA